jgi:hypothetical protein
MTNLRSTLRILLAAGAAIAALAVGSAPAQAASASSADGLCLKAFPHPFSRTTSIAFGKKTVYNRDLSRSLVCSGSFGAPDDYRPTFAAACDLAMAAYGVINPAETAFRTWGCTAPEIHDRGWVRGSLSAATGVACGYLANVLGVGVGMLAAGASLDPVVGVAVWKGVTFVGDTLVCVGVGNVLRDARSWGVRLESNHEVAVARDVERRGRCLQMTNRRVVGIQWSAVSCPAGYDGSSLPVPPSAGTTPQAGEDESQPAPAQIFAETTGGVTATWTDYRSGGGAAGSSIPKGQAVQIACVVQGLPVANGNIWWYRVASAPWNGEFYASADAFYNNGQTSGVLQGTPYVDASVPAC